MYSPKSPLGDLGVKNYHHGTERFTTQHYYRNS
jgi:hypothetical protein